jgi:hypothetical protein
MKNIKNLQHLIILKQLWRNVLMYHFMENTARKQKESPDHVENQ